MKKIFIASILTLLLLNCTKNASVSPIEKPELLTKQVWKIKKYVIGTPTKQTVQLSTDGTLYLQDISKISFTFKSDGTFSDTDYLGTAFSNQT
jgi:heat shock protein HslJ